MWLDRGTGLGGEEHLCNFHYFSTEIKLFIAGQHSIYFVKHCARILTGEVSLGAYCAVITVFPAAPKVGIEYGVPSSSSRSLLVPMAISGLC